MANLNKVMLIGRLTRDPEIRTFANGGRVAKFGFAVNNAKKNAQTGVWEEEPVFIDCDAFNRGDFGKLADTVEKYLRKGSQAYLEGRLKFEQWDDKTTGQKRSKLAVIVDVVQFLDPKPQDGSSPMRSAAPAASNAPVPAAVGGGYDGPPDDHSGGGGGTNGDIPF